MDEVNDILYCNKNAIQIRNLDKYYNFFHNEPSNPQMMITKNILIRIPDLIINLGVIVFVKGKDNYTQYFFNKTITYSSPTNTHICGYQIILLGLNSYINHYAKLTITDSNNINYDCYMYKTNLIISLLGAKQVSIKFPIDDVYLEYKMYTQKINYIICSETILKCDTDYSPDIYLSPYDIYFEYHKGKKKEICSKLNEIEKEQNDLEKKQQDEINKKIPFYNRTFYINPFCNKPFFKNKFLNKHLLSKHLNDFSEYPILHFIIICLIFIVIIILILVMVYE